MIKDVFELEPGTTSAVQLHERYLDYKSKIEALALSKRLIDTFVHVVNEAYDRALEQTREAEEAVSSPRASPRRSDDA